MNGLDDARGVRSGSALSAAALGAVGLAGFAAVGLVYHRLLRAGADFDSNFLTLALVDTEGALGFLPSLLLAGLVFHRGVATFVNGSLRGGAAKATGVAGSVLFVAAFLALAEGPAQGGRIGARIAEGIVPLVGKAGGIALFGVSALLAFWLATEGFSAPFRPSRTAAAAFGASEWLSTGPDRVRPKPMPTALPVRAPGGEPPGAPVGPTEPARASEDPKWRGSGGRYGERNGSGGETASRLPATEERVEAHEDAGNDARAVRGRAGGGALLAGGGSPRPPDAGADGDRPFLAGPGGDLAGGGGPLVDVDRRGAPPGPDDDPGEEPDDHEHGETESPRGEGEAGRVTHAGAPEEEKSPGIGDAPGERTLVLEPASPRGGATVRAEGSPLGESDLVPAAAEAIFEAGRASVTILQSRLGVPFARASRLLDRLEQLGLVGPYRGGSARDILLARAEWERRP
ncbi:MAG TPA: DNA translocase FtsK [Planctomycetota bacterium]|jgi:hypothetical protein|nr:DNA translocase FtsK [Planctomycetota bacterium]